MFGYWPKCKQAGSCFIIFLSNNRSWLVNFGLITRYLYVRLDPNRIFFLIFIP